MSKNFKRNRLFIDAEVQGALLRRTLLYWFLGVFGLLAMLTIWEVVQRPELTLGEAFYACWLQSSPVVGVSLILLPVIMYDILKMSNRVAGPLFRFQQEMKKLANGKGDEMEPLRFRGGDFWGDLAKEYNRIVNQVRNQDERLKEYFNKANEALPESPANEETRESVPKEALNS